MGEAPFKYFIKQKDVKIFSISVQDINKKLELLQGVAAEAAAVLIDNINFQINKTDKPLTDPKTVVFEEYHDFLDMFLKEASDTVVEHSKYNHQIRLLEGHKDLGHSLLREISQEQLEFVKRFLKDNLKKEFIKASSLPYSSPILLAKKPGRGIKFCVDY